MLLSSPALSIGERRARELRLQISEYSKLLCVGERDGEGLPWVYETAKMKICDIADGWKGKTLHFGVLFLRKLILIVKWQWEVSEPKTRSQVLSVHFLPLHEQGDSVLAGPTSPGAPKPSCKMGAIEFPAKC